MNRPFKVCYYLKSGVKSGRIASCGSPEGVVRSACVRVFSGQAHSAEVFLDDSLFAQIWTEHTGAVQLEVV